MTTYIPNNLRALRKTAGLKQQELATKLGLIAFDRISRWERGLSYPSVEQLVKLCELFRVQPIDIYPELFKDMNTEGVTHLPCVQQYTEVSPAMSQDGVFG